MAPLPSIVGKEHDMSVVQQHAADSVPTLLEKACKFFRGLFDFCWAWFDIGTDFLLASAVSEMSAPIGMASFLTIIAPYFLPACLAFILSFSGETLRDERASWREKALSLAMSICASPLLGVMGGCMLFLGFHGTRFGNMFGLVPTPTKEWKFNPHDNSSKYQAWFTNLVVGTWMSLFEDVPQAIIAVVVMSGAFSKGNFTIAVMSEAGSVFNLISMSTRCQLRKEITVCQFKHF